MPVTISGASGAAATLNRALLNTSKSKADFDAQVAAATAATSFEAWADVEAAKLPAKTAAQWSNTILNNVGILPSTVPSVVAFEQALTDYITANGGPARIGTIALQLGNLLGTLETATGDLAVYNAAAVAWNTETANSVAYSSNVNSTTSTTENIPAPIPPAQSFTLTTSVETVTGGTGNDTITGVASALSSENTLNATDVINGGAGADTLNLAVKGNFTGFSGAGKMEAVETVNLTSDSAIPRTFTATGVTGVTAYNVDATKGAISLDKLADLAAAITLSNQASGSFSVAYGTDVTKGTADKQTLNLTKVGTADDAATKEVNEESVVAVTIAGVEEIVSTVTGANVVSLTAADTKTMTVTGDGSLKITAAPTALKTFDASKVAGDVNIDLASATNATNVATGGGKDTVTANAGDDLTANATIALGAGADVLSLNGTGTVQYVLSGAETIQLKSLTGALTFSGTNTKDVTTIQADKAMGNQAATFANMGTGDLTVELKDANANTNVISTDHSGATTVNVTTPASTATATSPSSNAVAVTASKSTTLALNVAEKMDYNGVVTAAKATTVNVAIDGQTSGAAEVSAAAATSVAITKVANNSTLKVTAGAAKDLSVTAAKDLALTGSTLTAVESVVVSSGGLTTVTNLDKAAAITLSGAGSVDLGTVGTTAQDYAVSITATGLASNKATGSVSFDVGNVSTKSSNISINAAGVAGKVAIGAIDAKGTGTTSGAVTINLNGTGGTSSIGTIQGKNVTVDASGALGAVTYSAITTESGGAVTVKGATLSATTVTVNTGGASTADNTVSFTGGIAADKFTLVAAAGFNKAISTMSVTGGIQPAATTDELVLDGAAAALSITALTISDIELITVDSTNTVTVNSGSISGQTLEVAGGVLTLKGTTSAESIDLTNVTVSGAGAVTINALGGADTIKLGAGKAKVVYTATTEGADTVSAFTTTVDSITIDGALKTSLDGDTAKVAGDQATPAAYAIETAAIGTILKAGNVGGTAVTAANLTDLTKVAAQITAAFTITDAGADADLNTEIFVVESSDTTGTFGVYTWTQSSATDATVGASEMTLLGIYTGNGFAAGDITIA